MTENIYIHNDAWTTSADTSARREALRLAVSSRERDETAAETLAVAEAFRAFLVGEETK